MVQQRTWLLESNFCATEHNAWSFVEHTCYVFRAFAWIVDLIEHSSRIRTGLLIDIDIVQAIFSQTGAPSGRRARAHLTRGWRCTPFYYDIYKATLVSMHKAIIIGATNWIFLCLHPDMATLASSSRHCKQSNDPIHLSCSVRRSIDQIYHSDCTVHSSLGRTFLWAHRDPASPPIEADTVLLGP